MMIMYFVPALLLALVFSCLSPPPVFSEDIVDLTETKLSNHFLISPETRVDYTPLQNRLQ